MAKKGLTLDEKRAMITALFKGRNTEEEVVVEKRADIPPEIDEEEVIEKIHVKRKARHKKSQEGRIRPRGARGRR